MNSIKKGWMQATIGSRSPFDRLRANGGELEQATGNESRLALINTKPKKEIREMKKFMMKTIMLGIAMFFALPCSLRCRQWLSKRP